MSRWDGLTHDERFLSRINKKSGIFGHDGKYKTECWEWTGCLDDKGYGRITINNKSVFAHRFSYQYFVGYLQRDLDHLCRNRKCVRPDHLEPCSKIENVMRGESFSAINARKTHCLNGHLLSGDNLYFFGKNKNKRGCRQCCRERSRKRNNYQGNLPCKDRTHCPQGHEYNKLNTYFEPKTGKRKCKICQKAYLIEYRKKHG